MKKIILFVLFLPTEIRGMRNEKDLGRNQRGRGRNKGNAIDGETHR